MKLTDQSNWLGAVGFVLILMITSACSDSGAGIKVHHVGSPAPAAITIDQGKCSTLDSVDSDGKLLSTTDCGGPPGERRIAVKCAGTTLPEAFIQQHFPSGESHYVVFNNVCSSTADEIQKENQRARGRLAVWGKSTAK